MKRSWTLAVALPLLLMGIMEPLRASARTFQFAKYYTDSGCSTPSPTFYIGIFDSSDCATANCEAVTTSSATYYRTISCIDNVQSETKETYGTTEYVMLEEFESTAGSCDNYNIWNTESEAFSVGSCIQTPNATYASAYATVSSDSSVVLKRYSDDACSTLSTTLKVTSSEVQDNSCYSVDSNVYKVYTSNYPGPGYTGSDFASTTTSTASSGEASAASSNTATTSPSSTPAPRGNENPKNLGDSTNLWSDEAILGARIPRDKVIVDKLVNRGGYGELFAGTYNGWAVAIKMLHPEVRKSASHINGLLAEAKVMTMLDHPRIVHFVGVAWDSPTDLCVVTEFMEGGDLRQLLMKYQEQHEPFGFTHDKLKIALHVAHALTYLHSFEPPVIHRDLKSRNILLSADLDAQLTDFGVSRIRVDQTMTAAVGSSLWMAPEVMMGDRYDDKADVFSFGVVLSELNSHLLPYSHATMRDGSGGRMPDTAILQLVATGKLRVDFSQGSPEAMMRLGNACVSVDPKARPTAAEVLCTLQTILTQDMN
ncbi:hypothetical protein BBJ28_00002386 [Nothophytophthora sp. Chile5]|nr:hypothetical protein BBJ28_00002386 [Nothophytophthora sp. Chile5]